MPKDEFKGILRKSGFKATPTRIAVLAFMKKQKHPLNAQDIIGRFKKDADQATIYRILKDLKLSGIIRQIDLRHNHAHYELADRNDHHHLVCAYCGRIEDVEGCEVEDMYTHILKGARAFAKIQQHSLEFYGVCKNCTGKS